MKKSKFLKKSLAMLLALMLVVAMIPLSAAAEQGPSSLGLRYITVNGNTVDLTESSPTVQVNDLTKAYTVKLAAELSGNYELWALNKDGISHEEVTTEGLPLTPSMYYTVDGDTATFKLAVVDTKGDNMSSNDKQYDAWTITLEKVTAAVTTNVEVTKGAGVAKVDKVDNENKIVYLTLARHTGEDYDPANDWNQNTQDGMDAKITVTGLERATVSDGAAKGNSITVADADNGKTFQVTSASGGNTSTFTIVAEYEDALDSFSVDGAEGVITDENKDDVPDTITVTLPKDAILDKWGHEVPDPSFVVEYAVKGDVHCTVEIDKDGDVEPIGPDVANKDEVKFADLTNDTNWTGTVTVTRWDIAEQVYDLTVKLEDSTETGIEYVRVNTTEATASGDTSFHAVLPKNYSDNGTDKETKRSAVNVVIRTIPSITGVQINNASGNSPVVNMEEITSKTDPDYVSGQTAWKLPDGVTINATGTVVITLTAEDGSTKGTYTLTTEDAQANTDASITAFYIGDYKAQLTKSGGVNQEDIFTVTVPYMTLNVANLPIYATPSAGAKVQYTDSNSSTFDLINGYHTASNLVANYVNGKTVTTGWNLGSQIPTAGYLETKVTAVDKSDDTVKQDYIIRVQLSTDIATGNRLESLDFTAQPTSNNNDRAIMHAIDEDENVFKANVWENTDTSNNVGTINLYVPQSLMDNDEGLYNNVVLDYTTKDRGVAFAVINGDVNVNGDVRLAKLSCTVNDDSPTKISGTVINDIASSNPITGVVTKYNTEIDTIVVLPEQIARAVEGGYADTRKEAGIIDASEIWEYGTVYNVTITGQNYKHDADLISFKVGSSELTVNKTENTIEGTLNWADTTAISQGQNPAPSDAVFATFELSKYARAYTNTTDDPDSEKGTFSDGDWDGDGEAEDMVEGNKGNFVPDNLGFVFVRNADYSVTVYRATETNCSKIVNKFIVKAEDRLDNNDPSTSEWTFNLKWKDACDDADIETFSINGVSGKVDNSDSENRTITVNLPYGTPITGLVADFTTSPNAKVTLTTPDGVLVESGITSLNYTEGVLLYVTSESGENKNSYRVTVELGNHFSDIDENDWYYDNVMDAANNGYISGMGDGTFAPTQATTRAQFASMIANAMGYEADPDVASMFPDVADDFWGKAAINFCAQNGIITGYDDGTFQPNKAITRQEAASILRNAFKLTESSSETFPDDSAISGWAKESVYIVKASGLMKGDAGTGNFRPTDTIIRAEAASILMNAKYAGLIK